MTDQAAIARRWITQAVTGMTGQTGNPVSELTALTNLRAAITQAERDAACSARERGDSWAQIALALGIARLDTIDLADTIAAFERVASRLGRGPEFPWRCGSCGETVSDRGPGIPL